MNYQHCHQTMCTQPSRKLQHENREADVLDNKRQALAQGCTLPFEGSGVPKAHHRITLLIKATPSHQPMCLRLITE